MLTMWLRADDTEQPVPIIGCLTWCPITMIAMVVLGDVSERSVVICQVDAFSTGPRRGPIAYR